MSYTSSSHWSIVIQPWFECCKISGSVIGNEKQKHWYRPKKALSIELYLRSNQTWLVGLIAECNQLCRINSGIECIVKTQTHKEIFPNYHCFWSQHSYFFTIDVCSYKHGTENIFSLLSIQRMSAMQQWELLFIYTCIYLQNQSWESVAELRLWSAVYQDDGVIVNILVKSPWRRTIELQLLWWFYLIM